MQLEEKTKTKIFFVWDLILENFDNRLLILFKFKLNSC